MSDGPLIRKIRFTLTPAERHRLGRIARWERASASTNLTLGPQEPRP